MPKTICVLSECFVLCGAHPYRHRSLCPSPADKAEIFLLRILQQSPGYPRALETKILFHLPSPFQLIILGLQSFRIRVSCLRNLFVFNFLFVIRLIYSNKIVKESSPASFCRERKLQILSIFIQCRTWIKRGAKTGNGIKLKGSLTGHLGKC